MAEVDEVMKLLGERKVIEALKLSEQVVDKKLMAERLTHFAGQMEYGSGHYDIAETILQQSLLLDPENPYTYYNLGVHHTEDEVLADDLTNVELAIRAYKKALEIKPNLHEARYNLALMYYFTEDFNKAKVEFNMLLEACPNDLRFLEAKPLFDTIE